MVIYDMFKKTKEEVEEMQRQAELDRIAEEEAIEEGD